jgi:predicted AAA+ superfamily ATPase
MYYRKITPHLRDALDDSPVVLINGARQTGKTTLAQQFVSSPAPLFPDRAPGRKAVPDPASARTYLTLDDSTVLAAAKADAAGFIAGLTGPVVIDEVQHAPELFPAIKATVDRDRRPGRFLLTGSANVLLLSKLSESLAGRMEILTLWPLAQAEIEGTRSSVVDLLFSDTLPTGPLPAVGREELIRRLLNGGYPEPLTRKSETRRRAWFSSYLTTILQRDVRDIANIEGLSSLPRLLALLASRTASLLNLSDVSTAVKLPYATLYRYMAVLEATFLVQQLPAWSTNLGTRLVKTPKLLLNDTGLAGSLLGLDAGRLAVDTTLIRPLLETLVAMELKKDAGWSQTQPNLFHYRTHARQEVDIVLESAAGQIVGVEVKAAASVSSSDFNGLRSLAGVAGERFGQGVLLYTGEKTVPFSERLHAVPLSLLWR